MNGVGKPCTGKPYARFDEGAPVVTEDTSRQRSTLPFC